MLDLLRVNRLFRFLTPSIKLISIRRNYLHLLRPKNESEKAEQLVDSLRFITVFAAVFLHDVVYTAANGGIPLVSKSTKQFDPPQTCQAFFL